MKHRAEQGVRLNFILPRESFSHEFFSPPNIFLSLFLILFSKACSTAAQQCHCETNCELRVKLKLKKMDSYGAKYQVASNKIQFRHTYAASYVHEPQSKPYPVAPRPLHPRFTNLVQLIPSRKRARRERLVFKSRIVRSLVFKRGP